MKKLIGMLKSKTFWVNILGMCLQIVNKLQGEIIPVEAAVVIQTVVNILIRLITKDAVEDK
jgi:uncharacterized membrane protein